VSVAADPAIPDPLVPGGDATFRFILDTCPACIAYCSRDYRYLYVNERNAARFGRRPSEMVGRPIVEAMGEAAFQQILPYMDRVLAGEEVEFETELDYVTQGRRFVHVRYVPQRSAAGHVVGWVGVITDETERKQAELALIELDRRKDDFLATLAHELRNPLAPIANAVEILQSKGSADPQIERAHVIIDRQVRKLTRLVDDLLDVARITSGKIQLRKERIELAAVVHDAVESARPFVQAASHALVVTLPPEPVHLDADPTRLSQVLLNVLHNAAKYTPRGGHVWLTAELEKQGIVLRVRDDGIGIAPAHLPSIFGMFSQIAPALEGHGGLGIGLALVRRLVEMHGGGVEARSAGLDQGSEIIVRLPVAPPPARD
jgi:PAS domain S-box-containing protein